MYIKKTLERFEGPLMIHNQNYNSSRTMCSDNKCLLRTIKNKDEEERSLLNNISTRRSYILLEKIIKILQFNDCFLIADPTVGIHFFPF